MFDWGNWERYWIHYLIIIIILIIILYFSLNSQSEKIKDGRGDGEGFIFNRGRGDDSENIETLLDRIDWATYLYKRSGTYERLIIPTLIAVSIIIIIIYRKLPDPVEIILLIIIIYISFLAFTNFFYFHGDVYNDFYIKQNVDFIRDKLGLYAGVPPDPISSRPARMEVM